LALTLTRWVLIPPSYLLPMSSLWEAGTPHPHSILTGIAPLFSSGFWPLGILILSPRSLGKLLSLLSWCMLEIRNRSPRGLRRRARLLRLIDTIGRWSNLDPFTIMISAPTVQFGHPVHIVMVGGTLSFLTVVARSMLAAHALDPRLMWDAAAASHGSTFSSPVLPSRLRKGDRAAHRNA
jgi:paraquat-inducible protein A